MTQDNFWKLPRAERGKIIRNTKRLQSEISTLKEQIKNLESRLDYNKHLLAQKENELININLYKQSL